MLELSLALAPLILGVFNALGVALIGIVFIDAVGSGYTHAFVLSTSVLAVVWDSSSPPSRGCSRHTIAGRFGS